MSDYVMPPNQLKNAMNKQEAYKLLFKQHLEKNYLEKEAILCVHRIIDEQTPEDIEAIIEGRKIIEIEPAPKTGAGPLIPTLKDIMKDLNKDFPHRRHLKTEVPADLDPEPIQKSPARPGPIEVGPMNYIDIK